MGSGMLTPTDTMFEYAPPRCWYATSQVQLGLRSLFATAVSASATAMSSDAAMSVGWTCFSSSGGSDDTNDSGAGGSPVTSETGVAVQRESVMRAVLYVWPALSAWSCVCASMA